MTDNETALNHIYLMSEDNLFPPQLKIKDIFKTTEGFMDPLTGLWPNKC